MFKLETDLRPIRSRDSGSILAPPAGWFSQTHPKPKRTGQFLSILTNCWGCAMVRIYPLLAILFSQMIKLFCFPDLLAE
jgi:hypothetical protein